MIFSILEKRRFVRPNPGFEAQLRLYATMGWQIDPKNTEYKYFRLSIASDKMRKGKNYHGKILQTPNLKNINIFQLKYYRMTA